MQEEDFLFDKSYQCPVCDNKMKVRTIRTGKARLLRTDMDLRPVYDGVEPLKYEPVVCPCCGYSALARNFGNPTSSQRTRIKENISKTFQLNAEFKDTYTYDESVYGYKMCLANAIVMGAKVSEIAYICLKIGWLYRSQAEALSGESSVETEEQKDCRQKEAEYLKKAYDEFVMARQSEIYPMCGMDEMTVEYLIAALAMETGDYEMSSRLVGNLLTSQTANHRIKDRAREVKEELLVRMKDKEG